MNLLTKITIPFILFFANCTAQTEVNDINYNVIYEAKTRGSFINIQFQDTTITYKSATENKLIVLNNLEVIAIKSVVSKIKLSEIENLIAPSNKRFSDGALIGNFIIKKDDTSYTSSDFDHENPPKELQELYTIFQKYLK